MRDIVVDDFMIFMSVDVKTINCVEEFITKVPIGNQDTWKICHHPAIQFQGKKAY